MFFISLLFAQSNDVCTIFFDGTTNDKTQGTNVWAMFKELQGIISPYTPSSPSINKDNVEVFKKSEDITGGKHRSIYVSGVGTSKSLTAFQKNAQAITGAGIEKRAILGYDFAIHECESVLESGYQLKIIGFSRGAATARMFATYLSLYGFSITNLIPVGSFSGLTNFEYTFLNPKTVSATGRVPTIAFLGIYDTVAAIGITRKLDPDNPRSINLPGEGALAKLSLKIPGIVVNCAHAVAINEYRYAFAPTYINKDKPTWVEQYFIGSHSDIGGYLNTERQQIAMSWLASQGMRSELPNHVLDDAYVLSLRASSYRNSYIDVTVLDGVISRSVDWTSVNIDVIQVGKDGGLTAASDLQVSGKLNAALLAAAKVINGGGKVK